MKWRKASRRLYFIIMAGLSSFTFAADPSDGILKSVLNQGASKVYIAAHRGGYENDREDQSPENSLANIQTCKRYGYELFETDIRRTRDGHFVIVHDPTVERETSGAGDVNQMTLLELRALRKRYRDRSLSSEPVATLKEFLEHGKGAVLFKADLKPGVSAYFADIMKLVAAQKAFETIIFRVPYHEATIFEKYQNSAGVIPKHTLMFKVNSKKQIDDIYSRFRCSTIEIKLDKSDPTSVRSLSLIRYAAKKGFVVETHAEGNEADWNRLIKAGVRIFHTNAPSKLKQFLQKQAVTE